MKKIIDIILGIWCAITSFISPLWLTLVFLNITGLIYRYDYTMDEGTAGIIGTIGAALWCLFVLLPDVIFLKRLKAVSSKKMFLFIGLMLLLSVICIGMCKWNMIAFLMT